MRCYPLGAARCIAYLITREIECCMRIDSFSGPLHWLTLLSSTNAPYGIPCSRYCKEPAGKTHEPRTPAFAHPLHLSSPENRPPPREKGPLLAFFPKFTQRPPFLLGGLGDSGLSTLRTLLADVADGLALGRESSVLRLLSLLGGLGGLLLLLVLLDGLGAGGGTGLGAHGALLLDHIEGGTNDGTLVLDGSPGALLGDLL